MNWSVQDWCAIIGALGVVCGGVLWFNKWVNKKFKITKANIRVNFFKMGKSWRFRIYNSSEEDIEVQKVRIYFPEEDDYDVDWDSEKDEYPSLKRHGSFDIVACLYNNSPRYTTVRIQWHQNGSKKIYSTTETVALH